MLTQEENDLLTRIGPGTPAGELLRRYWHPVGYVQELTDEQPTRFVRILGEDLVLFKDKSGHVGLLADHCSHRGASLLYGRVEERGIACAYHGWLYDAQGNCLECPAEPAGSLFHLTVKQRAYPVRRFIGMYWAYLGPEPGPEIPHYDVWARRDGQRVLRLKPRLDCNWFQAMENSVDPAHLQILHQDVGGNGANRRPANTTRGRTDDVEEFEFVEVPCGIIKKRSYRNGLVDEHPLIFPNILRNANRTQMRVPIDDTHTNVFIVEFHPGPDGSGVDLEDERPEVIYEAPYKAPIDARHPFARFRLDEVPAQDYMAWETQGPITDRRSERLATTDRGIVLYRRMIMREIERTREGLDPLGVVRERDHPIVDTNLEGSLREYVGRRRSG
ncbi:MAG: Rieske 2Fe-2S domain-containing protein [Chloroflexi bacterium]|nr:Rieske 2Fe-2S domain-containing protein [Chloroflexota bacterium]